MTKAAYRRKDLFLVSFPELESVMAGRAGRVSQEVGGQVLNCKHEVEVGVCNWKHQEAFYLKTHPQ